MDSRSTSRRFPGFSSLHELSSTGAVQAFIADAEMTDEESRLIPRAEITPAHPVQARWAMGGKKPRDIVWTTFAVPVLVSERVVTVLQQGGFRGWGAYDVELAGHDGVRFPGYYGLSVHGRCGPLDYTKSVKVVRIYPGGVFPVWMGLYFDPESWDGADIFMPEGSDFLFVVETVKKVFRKERIGNVQFTPLPEIERDWQRDTE